MLLAVLRNNEDEGRCHSLSTFRLELWTGNWGAAEDYGQRHLDAALRTGPTRQPRRNNLALIDIHRATWRGRRYSPKRCAADRELGMWTERNGLGLLGMAALAEGDAPRCRACDGGTTGEQMALREPGYRRQLGDLVQALVATGNRQATDYAAEIRGRQRLHPSRAGACQRALVAATAATATEPSSGPRKRS